MRRRFRQPCRVLTLVGGAAGFFTFGPFFDGEVIRRVRVQYTSGTILLAVALGTQDFTSNATVTSATYLVTGRTASGLISMPAAFSGEHSFQIDLDAGWENLRHVGVAIENTGVTTITPLVQVDIEAEVCQPVRICGRHEH